MYSQSILPYPNSDSETHSPLPAAAASATTARRLPLPFSTQEVPSPSTTDRKSQKLPPPTTTTILTLPTTYLTFLPGKYPENSLPQITDHKHINPVTATFKRGAGTTARIGKQLSLLRTCEVGLSLGTDLRIVGTQIAELCEGEQ